MTSYRAPWWLPGGQAQTLWPLLRKGPLPRYRRQRWDTPDGDFLDLDWVDGAAEAPLLVLFHGLEGSSRSHYARALMRAVAARGWRGVVVHFRGCSGETNRLPRAYHSGDTAEIDWVLHRLAAGNAAPLFAVGVSLGGNCLLKWLGERGSEAQRLLAAAAAVSAPLDLAAANAALARGFNRLYTRHFLRTLVARALGKAKMFPASFCLEAACAARSLRDFDDAVTAPLHGFAGAADYYARSSAAQYLGGVRVPTLVVNSCNDPFLPAAALPAPAQLAPAIRFETPAQGGHVGFVSGPFPGHLRWLPQHLLDFCAEQLARDNCGVESLRKTSP